MKKGHCITAELINGRSLISTYLAINQLEDPSCNYNKSISEATGLPPAPFGGSAVNASPSVDRLSFDTKTEAVV